ncbi:hypothetical protein [Amycolatopsis sp. NPDC021455]|uniref:hypothetical protein n=1 Tax=Amycolatopsis sp. NPDC021455 TaxID=3154901 RepID=UPI0033EFD43E
MTFDWRPSRPDPPADGRGRCGAPIGPAFTRCAGCVLPAEDAAAVRVKHEHDDLVRRRLLEALQASAAQAGETLTYLDGAGADEDGA